MIDMLADGMAFLTTQLTESASEPVTYMRGNDSVAVRAVLGERLLKIEGPDGGFRMVWTDMDFLIPGAQLVLAGKRTTPLRGDRIMRPRSGHVYEVLPYGNDPPWRWCDPFHKMLRIHTKQVVGGHF